MEDRRIEGMGESAQAGTRRIVDNAQDAAARAGSYMQARVGRVSERAQDLAQEAGDRLERMTGRPLESWTSEARRFVQDHPLQAIAITVGLGFVLGKMLSRD
jgi:ElaB/YqjD/DUF883 family membrane-anchored ribosome-binding protein